MNEEFFITIDEQGTNLSARWMWEKFKLPPGRYKVTIKKGVRHSQPQRGYYFGGVCRAALDGMREQGWDWVQTIEDAHKELEHYNLKITVVNSKTAEAQERTGSIKNLSTLEMNDYIERCIKFLAEEFGVAVPAPGEQTHIF